MDIFAAYAQLTQDIVNITGVSRPMLHMHAGMAIYLGAQVVLGTRRGSLFAVIVVLQIELLNEMMNRFYHGSWRWADTSEDIALTLFWPTLRYGVSLYRRKRWQRMELRRNRRLQPGLS